MTSKSCNYAFLVCHVLETDHQQSEKYTQKKYKKHHSDRNKWKIVSEFVSWQVSVKIQYCTGK